MVFLDGDIGWADKGKFGSLGLACSWVPTSSSDYYHYYLPIIGPAQPPFPAILARYAKRRH